jgi:hypothetical protein
MQTPMAAATQDISCNTLRSKLGHILVSGGSEDKISYMYDEANRKESLALLEAKVEVRIGNCKSLTLDHQYLKSLHFF